jgi:3,5-epimerase/4-reductase
MNFFKKTKVLIYGSKGWIGGLFINYLKENHPKIKIVEGICRVGDTALLKNEIKMVNPTHIISFIGRTHGKINELPVNTIDYLEYPGKLVENVCDNLFCPLTLADICSKQGIHYTYLGTGCIFNSALDQTFTEDSLPNYFGSGYSVVKGFTDRLMKNYPVLNLRIRMPIHSVKNDRNFITKITCYSKICSIKNSMTVLDDFFPIFVNLLIRKKTGTYNCTNPGTIDHNEILEMYRDNIDPSFKWENMTIEEQSKILKSDRSNNELDTSKIKKEYPELKNIKQSVFNIIAKYKK